MTIDGSLIDRLPVFADPVAVARPVFEHDEAVLRELAEVLATGIVTNGRKVREFEFAVAEFLGTREVVAVSSCTTGLMLSLRCLEISGNVVVPSFTFMATGHAIAWNGATPIWADVDPEAWTLAPQSARSAAADATALVPVHTFGAPCDMAAIENLAARRGIPVIVDAAHGFGGRYPDGTMIGAKGTAEVFSLSPTKTLSVGEGGLIATNDVQFACLLRTARDNGNPGDYDSKLTGLNGRMIELAAVLGLANLRAFPRRMAQRRALARRYRQNLAGIPGLALQNVPAGGLSAVKDLVVRVTPGDFGMTRDALAEYLGAANIASRRYFDPPLHRQTAYRDVAVPNPLPVTEVLAGQVLTLPLHARMTESVVDQVCAVVRGLHERAFCEKVGS
jgi:dTDP-4-amino-4,6-dideoxygalactose transaminase